MENNFDPTTQANLDPSQTAGASAVFGGGQGAGVGAGAGQGAGVGDGAGQGVGVDGQDVNVLNTDGLQSLNTESSNEEILTNNSGQSLDGSMEMTNQQVFERNITDSASNSVQNLNAQAVTQEQIPNSPQLQNPIAQAIPQEQNVNSPQLQNPIAQAIPQEQNVNSPQLQNPITQAIPQEQNPIAQNIQNTPTTQNISPPINKLSDSEKRKIEEEEAKKNEQLKIKNKELQDAILSANIPQLVMIAISYALEMRSSDIHIEPLMKTVRIRYRVDGVLMHIVEYPLNLHPAVVSRIKIMSNLKIDEQRIPQDGRADVTTKEGKEMDLRVSSLPTVNGEKIVMRLQDKSRTIPDLPELGITGISLRNLEEALKSPNGIIINTGPTGSGKTTTLYSCLTRKNEIGVNILTIEDPVEIQLDGLNQSQVNHDIEYNFATGMRAALRQDPDIIMVGEIRDRETADTAIEASLTGHLVFSTLHTNSAVESITRLVNMGVPAYLLNSTIELIIAQRLVRKLCDNCKRIQKLDKEMLIIVKKAIDTLEVEGELDSELVKKMEFYEPVGCDKCNNIGYKGRIGLYEVFRMNNEVRKLITAGGTPLDIQDAAMRNGMVTLEQAGVIRALEGKTSIEEVYRVARKME